MVARRPFDDSLIEGGQAASSVHGFQRVHLTAHLSVRAPCNLSGGGQVNITEECAGGGREERQKQQRQAKGRGPQQARCAHLRNPP